jgi:signal transduction histidine kinase
VQKVENASAVADPERLIQALSNMIENAIKFSPAESPVEVFAGVESQEAVFRVRDYGFGIAETQLPSVFNPMEQLDASDTRAQGGLGMGLAISRRIVELHGGRIGVDSTLGEGSTFWFTIPVEK